MQKQCQAKAGHAKKTFDVVSGSVFDENFDLSNRNRKADDTKQETGVARKKFNILPTNMLLKPAKMQNALLTAKINGPYGQSLPSNDTKTDLTVPIVPSTASTMDVSNYHNVDSTTKSAVTKHDSATEDKNDSKEALNQHLSKLREQLSDMHDSASQKMLELQSELGKMQHMSHEFDVLAEFLTSEAKLSIFGQNLDRLQNTVQLTEDKIHEINTNNQKMARMIRQVNETTKRQHENNDRAIVAIGERLERWELKLDRVTRKMSTQKADWNDSQVHKIGDLAQLKDDIDGVLNSRLVQVSHDMENMKNVVIGIIALIVLKMFVFDLFKDDLNGTLMELTATK